MGAAAIPIGIGLTAIGTGYQIYSSERAAQTAAKQYHDAQQQADQQRQSDQQRLDQQTKDQATALQAQKDAEATQQAKMAQEQQANITNIRGSLPGIETAMGQNLAAQNKSLMETTNPLIEDRLNALGLLQSGALPEAQARYQAQIDEEARNQIANFDIAQQQNLNVGLPTANTEEQVALQNQNLQADIGQASQNLTQQYTSADANAANNLARQQYLAGLGAGVNQMNAAVGSSIGQGVSNAGGALMNYGALARNPNTSSTMNPALAALYYQRNPNPNQNSANLPGFGPGSYYNYSGMR